MKNKLLQTLIFVIFLSLIFKSNLVITETKEALQDNIKKIIKATKQVLEQTSPELSADIVDKGVIITGGGSMLNGLSEVLEEELTIPVLTTQTPLTCVAEGTGILLNNIKLLEEDQ